MRTPRLYLWAGSLILSGFGSLCIIDSMQQNSMSSFLSVLLPRLPTSSPTNAPVSNIFDGQWKRMETPPTYENVTQTWGGAFQGCWMPASLDQITNGGREPEQTADWSTPGRLRLVELMSYEWEPLSGETIRRWDIEQFIVRCMNSRIGMVIVGDSLQWHWFQVIKALLEVPSVVGPLATYGNEIKTQHTMTLNPLHPLFNYILKMHPSIPRSRLSEPFLYQIEDAWMVPWHIADSFLVSDYGDAPGWKPKLGDGDKRVSATWGAWTGKKVEETKGWRGEQDSLILINTGPHWFAPGIQFRRDSAKVLTVLQKALEVYLPTLLEIPHIHLVFRAIAPGHENCNLYTEPLDRARALWTPLPLDNPPDAEHADEYRWSNFPKINRFVQDIITRMRMKSLANGEEPRATFFDVYDMSMQRPDAKKL